MAQGAPIFPKVAPVTFVLWVQLDRERRLMNMGAAGSSSGISGRIKYEVVEEEGTGAPLLHAYLPEGVQSR